MGILDTLRQYRKDNKERAVQREIENDAQIRKDMDDLREHQKRLNTRMEHDKLKHNVHEQERSMSWVNRLKQQVGANVVKNANTPPKTMVSRKAAGNTIIYVGGGNAVKPERAAPTQKEEVDERSNWAVGKVKKHDWGL